MATFGVFSSVLAQKVAFCLTFNILVIIIFILQYQACAVCGGPRGLFDSTSSINYLDRMFSHCWQDVTVVYSDLSRPVFVNVFSQ